MAMPASIRVGLVYGIALTFGRLGGAVFQGVQPFAQRQQFPVPLDGLDDHFVNP